LRTGPIYAELTGLLASLPHLTELWVNVASNVDFLNSLPSVRQLTLVAFNLEQVQATPEQLIAAIGQCEQITDLFVMYGDLEAKHVAALLSRMPAVRKLHFKSVPRLESLSFLSSEPLQRSLTSLTLSHYKNVGLRTAELRHVFDLPQLAHLHLHNSLSETLDSLTKHDLTVPSKRLPKLVESKIRDDKTW